MKGIDNIMFKAPEIIKEYEYLEKVRFVSILEELELEHWKSCLFQIIMSLLVYQKLFDFTHNDLHTNNIMFKKTEKMYLYYYYNKKYYKVPTYGRIYKIIDFGRAIYKFKNKTAHKKQKIDSRSIWVIFKSKGSSYFS